MCSPLDIFGSTFACSCGKTHRVTPNILHYGFDAVERLPDVLASMTSGRSVGILSDSRTQVVAGERIVASLQTCGWRTENEILPDPPSREGEETSPVCDEPTLRRVDQKMPTVDILLAVGAGVISDLMKWLAYERDLPYVAFATAASMNGYTSANVAPTLGGIKTLLRARPPVAVLADPILLAEAPWRLTAAGLGDLLAKSVSSSDWRLHHLLFGDYYCPRSVELIAEIEPLYLNHPEAVAERDPRAIEALFYGLLLTGAAMTIAESSAPASGGEHLISHTLDMMSALDSHPHDLHGRQVGIGTILTSRLYEEVLAIDSPKIESPDLVFERWDPSFWGALAPAVSKEMAEKRPRLLRAAQQLAQPGIWQRIREELRPLLRPAARIQECLRRAGAAWRAQHIGCSKERLLTAFLHAHEIRSRFTILDLAYLVGVMPKAAPRLIEEWS